MKQKEIKDLAKKIAKVTIEMENCQDEEQLRILEDKQIELCGKARNIEDMVAIDDMVQRILEKI